jgi:hypothetical protein
MLEHLHARCGDYHLLFPSENIGVIEAVPSHFVERGKRDRSGEVVIDLRRLLGAATIPVDELSTFEWRSTDGSRRAVLVVDAVEEIVRCHVTDLIPAPFLPPRLRPYCDSVMRGSGGRFHLRVRLDVVYPSQARRPAKPGTPDDCATFSRDLGNLRDFLQSLRVREVVCK